MHAVQRPTSSAVDSSTTFTQNSITLIILRLISKFLKLAHPSPRCSKNNTLEINVKIIFVFCHSFEIILLNIFHNNINELEKC